MKILKTIHQFLPRHVAGSEVHTYHLCKELLKRHDVLLLYPDHFDDRPSLELRESVYDGIPVTTFKYPYGSIDFEKTYRNQEIDALFSRILDSYQPDIFHIQHLFYLTPRFILLARERGIPVVMTLHEYGSQCAASGLRMRSDFKLCDTIDPRLCAGCLIDSPHVFHGGQAPGRFEKAVKRAARMARRPFELAGLDHALPRDPALRQVLDRESEMRETHAGVDLFIAPSKFLREKFREWGIPSEKLLYLNYGFEREPLLSVRKEPSEKVRFAYIGSVMPHKGVDLLVEAFNGLPHGGAELKIYGEPSFQPAFYQKLRENARHPGIRFEGFLPVDKVAEAYQRIDALVVPSRWFENSPLTMQEAFLCGSAVIASDLGGMKELVTPRVNGLLFETGNVQDLRRAMLEYLSNPGFFESEKIRCSVPLKNLPEYSAEVEAHYERLLAGCKTAKSVS